MQIIKGWDDKFNIIKFSVRFMLYILHGEKMFPYFQNKNILNRLKIKCSIQSINNDCTAYISLNSIYVSFIITERR